MLPFSRTNSGDNFSPDVNQRSSRSAPGGPESFLNTIKKLPSLQRVKYCRSLKNNAVTEILILFEFVD